MSDANATADDWAKEVAALAVDALLDAKLIPKEQLEAARDIVALEINVRLCLGDYPPAVDHSNKNE